ncbi:hypothetical protein ABZ297_30430 [Nonomuraea sp. NPDC005983]|uniref:hypothetical protein n=1 Tax=Nonomuraea sp. NPDC005983 TaxID=3155595 RepID=UPI0033A09D52
MKSVVLARKAAAFGASTAVLAAMVTGLMAGSAQAATTSSAAKATPATSAKAKTKVSVSTPKASSGDYQGSCPVDVKISSTIKVKLSGKTELAYRWLHGDGSKGKVKVVKLKGHGTKSIKVSETLSFKDDVKGWEAIQVLGPRKVTSKKGYFSVSCVDIGNSHNDKDVSISARAWANPDSYVGPCTPGDKIDFVGLIKTDQPTWVRYRWVLNGDVVDYGRVKVWNTRKVAFGLSPRHSQRGSAVLEILGPDRTSSNRAYYKVWCKSEAPSGRVSVSSLVTGTNNDGCKVGAHATLSSTGPARVRWVWSVNGDSVLRGESVLRDRGSETINLPDRVLTGDATKGGKVTLTVFGPNNSDSITQSYAACEAPKPTVTVSSVAVAGQRNNMCADGRGPGVDFKATISSSAPTTVKYYWVVNGKREMPDLERQVNGSVDVTWGIGGTQGASETTGSVQLVVFSPDNVSSGASTFSVTCPPKA